MLELFTTLEPHSGVLKIVIFQCFLEPCFGMVCEAHVGDVGSLLGFLLETILVTFWGTIFVSIFRPSKNIENGGGPLARPEGAVHAPPPPRTPPPQLNPCGELLLDTARPGRARAFRNIGKHMRVS